MEKEQKKRKRRYRYNLICQFCGDAFQNSNKETKYCSKDCRLKSKKKNVYPPTREQLYKLIKNNELKEIAEMYEVKTGTIRKWCKENALPYSQREIDMMNLIELKPFRLTTDSPEDDAEYTETVDYKEAPINMINKYNRSKTFNNIYEASEYVKKKKLSMASQNTILKGIKKAVIDKTTYIGYRWVIDSIDELRANGSEKNE